MALHKRESRPHTSNDVPFLSKCNKWQMAAHQLALILDAGIARVNVLCFHIGSKCQQYLYLACPPKHSVDSLWLHVRMRGKQSSAFCFFVPLLVSPDEIPSAGQDLASACVVNISSSHMQEV